MRLIDADKIEFTANGCGHPNCKDICEHTKDSGECCGWLVAHKREVDKIPTIDAEPVRHGRWIESPDNDGMDYECSNLKCRCRISYNDSRVSGDFNYCPNCGAKMDEVSE